MGPVASNLPEDPIRGFGSQRLWHVRLARETNVFKRSEPLIIYTEPFGFAYGRDGQMFVIDMALDFEIRDAAGASIAA